jgi:hypothetical protein
LVSIDSSSAHLETKTCVQDNRLYSTNTLPKFIQYEMMGVWPTTHQIYPGNQNWGPGRFPRSYNTKVCQTLAAGAEVNDAWIEHWDKGELFPEQSSGLN